MSVNWFTDKLPWRFLVIRRNYFRNAQIARACPEIKGEINRNAFLLMVALWVWVPLGLLMLPFLIMRTVGGWVTDLRFGRWLPDFEEMRIQSVREANAKVSPQEVMRRLEEQGTP
jgi:hypothetical protein